MDNSSSGGNVFGLRNYRLVFFGALVSELGGVLYSFAVSFYILEISSNNAFLQGLYLFACGIVLLLLTPAGGVLGDRYNKAKIMFICDYIKGGLIIAAALFMLLFQSAKAHIGILFAVGILGNAVSGIFSPAAGGLLPYIVEEERLQQANAYFSVKNALQSIFGIVLAGVLYASLSINLLFFIVGICYVLSGVSEMFIRYEHVAPKERMTVKLALSDMKEGLVYLKGQKVISAMMVSILFINFFIAPVSGNFVPYFVKTDIALAGSYLFDRILTPELWSSVFSMLIGVSSLAGSVILSARPQPDKCGETVARRIMGIAGAMIALAAAYGIFVAMGKSLNVFLILFSLGSLLLGFLLVFINVPFSTAMMRTIDKSKISKVSSILNVMSQGLIPIASVIAGGILETLGSTWLLIICAAGFTVTAVRLLLNRRIREI